MQCPSPLARANYFQGETFLRNKHKIAFFLIKCKFFGGKEQNFSVFKEKDYKRSIFYISGFHNSELRFKTRNFSWLFLFLCVGEKLGWRIVSKLHGKTNIFAKFSKRKSVLQMATSRNNLNLYGPIYHHFSCPDERYLEFALWKTHFCVRCPKKFQKEKMFNKIQEPCTAHIHM